ncbi:MAG: DNA translocase FtsK 4TM domain-containing protein, partial [Myxococcales bacterium]|nr:DNA translocase FtsK 4TM domain-containing protein [Myxococcales bacterium]
MALPDTTSADDWDDELDGDPRGEPEGRRHEVLGVLAVSATVLMTLALLSHDPGGENWVGAVGAGLASVLLRAFGYAAWIIPIELGLLAPRLFRRTRTVLGLATLASTFVFGLTGCALVHLTLSGSEILAGGV